jgi:hypothetical protein
MPAEADTVTHTTKTANIGQPNQNRKAPPERADALEDRQNPVNPDVRVRPAAQSKCITAISMIEVQKIYLKMFLIRMRQSKVLLRGVQKRCSSNKIRQCIMSLIEND